MNTDENTLAHVDAESRFTRVDKPPVAPERTPSD
jgi:hypothetical protein